MAEGRRLQLSEGPEEYEERRGPLRGDEVWEMRQGERRLRERKHKESGMNVTMRLDGARRNMVKGL